MNFAKHGVVVRGKKRGTYLLEEEENSHQYCGCAFASVSCSSGLALSNGKLSANGIGDS